MSTKLSKYHSNGLLERAGVQEELQKQSRAHAVTQGSRKRVI